MLPYSLILPAEISLLINRKLDLLPGQKTPEWVMIELQGDLQTDSDLLAGQEIGTIHISALSTERQEEYDPNNSVIHGEVCHAVS